MTEFYYILHTPTGTTMPAKTFGRGVTSRKFDNSPPRLFARKQDAKVSLGYYLKGKWNAEWCGDYYSLDCTIIPQPDRKPADFEIIPIAFSRSEGT